jgi:hypothetical protein
MDLVGFFCRHLVGLSVVYQHVDWDDQQLPPRLAVCSGTLIYVSNALYFLTAGHVLRELDQLRHSDGVEIKSSALVDIFGNDCVDKNPIPLELQIAELIYTDDGNLGHDFGIMRLSFHYANLLQKNGIVALTAKNWSHQTEIDFDLFYMLGLPQELTSERATEAGWVNATPVLMRVTCDNTPDQRNFNTKFPRFVGRLDANIPLNSLSGMSGGPIFGFRDKPEPKYWIVAIQSSWIPSSRIVYGCRLSFLGSWLEEWAKLDENVA